MALTISEFKGVGSLANGDIVQVADGPPSRVTANASGAYTVGDSAVLIRVFGNGTITWPGITDAEPFDGLEFRRVRPGNTFTVA